MEVVAPRIWAGRGDSPYDSDYPVVAEWVMYYHGYMEDLAAAIARARGAAGDPSGHPAKPPDRHSRSGVTKAWPAPSRLAVAIAAAGLLALLAPTTAAESAPRASAGLADVDAVGVVPCGITDLITRTPPAVDQPCVAEWWSWKHYLATLPRLP